MMGVALGTAIPMIIIKLFIQPVYTCNAVKLSIAEYYYLLIGSAVKPTFVILTLAYISRNFIAPSYFSLVSVLLCQSAIFAIVIFFIGLTKKERDYFKAVVYA